jgi:glycosyltransferase involved in cell wall biosynthesis
MGGMELHTEILRRGLVANGHRVTTITTQLPSGPTTTEDQWGETYFVGQGAPGMYGPDWWQESLRTFQRIHASDPVDVIASQSGGARACIEAQRRLPVEERVPSVLILHNTNIDNLHSHLKQIYRHPARAILRWIPRDIVLWRDNRRWLHFADHITVLSQSSALALVRWHPVEKSQVTVIPNGVDVEGITTAEVQRGEVRRQMGLHDQDTAILILASLVERKGQHHMLDALASPLLRKYGHSLRLILAGEGPMREKLERQCARLGLAEQVLFAGRIPHEEVPGLLSAADIVALPALSEGMPLALLEAMAAGHPVVATRVGAIPEILEDRTTGLLVPPGSPDALAHAVDELLRDLDAARFLGAKGREFVLAHNDQRAMVHSYERVLMDVTLGRAALSAAR